MVEADAPVPVRIRHAALKLFAARGFDATGIREIAEVAAIPTSLLYHYRRAKEEILRDLILEGLSRHLESSRRAIELSRRPEESLRIMVGIHVLVPLRNPEMARIMEFEVRSLSSASQKVVRRKRTEGDQRWEAVLRDGASAGVFTVPDVHLARRVLLRMCTGLTISHAAKDGMTADKLVTRLSDYALGVVRARRNRREVRGDDLTHPTIEELQQIVDAVHSDEVEIGAAG